MTIIINYELIYKLRKGGYSTDEKHNLQNQFENKARIEANAIHEKYRDFLKRELGHDRFEITNIACIADGVLGHVYTWPKGPKPQNELGKKTCCFCNLDDFGF